MAYEAPETEHEGSAAELRAGTVMTLVTDVRVSLDTGLLLVTSKSPVEDAAVAAVVDEAGYALAGGHRV